MGLAAVGTCAYNGITFGVPYKSSITGRAVQNKAKNAVAYVEYTVEIEATLTNSSQDTGLLMSKSDSTGWRQLLMQSGRNLKITGTGFGDLVVNDSSRPSIQDVAGGPIPEVLSWKTYGNNLAADVRWRCTTRVVENAQNSWSTGQILDYGYSTTFAIDQDGYSRITYRVTATIPSTRAGSGNSSIEASADKLREKITPPILSGFQRLDWTWELSDDKRTMTATIVDQEIPFPLPLGTTRCDIRQSVGSSLRDGWAIWHGHISGSITMAADQDHGDALARFLGIVKARLSSQVVQNDKGTLSVIYPQARGAGTVVLDKLNIEEEIYGRSARFDLGYMILGSSIDSFIEASGLFSVPRTGYRQWAQSLAGSAFSPRGNARIQHLPNQEAIISLGPGDSQQVAYGYGIRPSEPSEEPDDQPNPAAERVDKEASWLFFRNVLDLHEIGGKTLHKPLGGNVTQKSVPNADSSPQALSGAADGNPLAIFIKSAVDGFQQSANPTYHVVMYGVALRLQHPIQPPQLLTVGGSPATLRNRKVRNWQPTGLNGVPVFGCKWRLEYTIPVTPKSNLNNLSNPAFELEGNP